MASKAQAAASDRYDRAHTVQIKLKLNRKTDADIIALLNRCDNKQGYIKDLIRADLKNYYK